MSQAAKHALRNTELSRSTVSKKIKVLDGLLKRILQNPLINLMYFILKWMKFIPIFNMVVTKFVLVQLFMKVMKKILLKERNLKIFVTSPLQN